jgi:hypothetical protein
MLGFPFLALVYLKRKMPQFNQNSMPVSTLLAQSEIQEKRNWFRRDFGWKLSR